MNSLETDSYTMMSKSHYSRDLLHNSKLSTEYKILSFLNEITTKKDTEKVYTLYCYCINLHFNEENQI